MLQKIYPFSFEIAGQLALFANPTASPNYVSYSFPTLSAVEGWIKSIAHVASAQSIVEKVTICRPIRFHQHMFNNTGFGRKEINIKAGNSEQYRAFCLVDVTYQVDAYTERSRDFPKEYNEVARKINSAHHLQEKLLQRIAYGVTYNIPFLGWREFTTSYFGPKRKNTQVFPISMEQKMLIKPFTKYTDGVWNPVFDTVKAENGVVYYGDLARKINV